MICGLIEETPQAKRARVLEDRETSVIQLLTEGVPIANIAELEGVDLSVMTRFCRGLITKHSIDYVPIGRAREMQTPGITDASVKLRNHLGSYIGEMRDHQRLTEAEVGRLTGLPARAQQRARNRSKHNWTISQMERLAEATNQPFMDVLLRGMFSAEDLPHIIKTLVPPARRQTEAQKEAIKCSKSLLNSLS